MTDSQGRSVTGLGGGNFTLTENGQARQIDVMCSTSGGSGTPGSIGIVIDVSGSLSTADFNNEKTAAKQLVDSLGPNDSIAVWSFGSTVVLAQNFTTDKAAVKAAIDAIPRGGSTALYAAIQTAANAMAARSGRKAIVLMTDGENTVSGVTIDAAISAAKSAGVPVFSVGFGGIDVAVLTRISNETGGFFVRGGSSADLQSILTTIGQVLTTQCMILYTPASPSASATVVVSASAGGNTGSETRTVGPCAAAPGGSCPITVTEMTLEGGSFSGTFSGNGQIWDTINNSYFILGVSAPSPGSPLLNNPNDASINIPAGTYYTYNHPTTFGFAVRITIRWSDGAGKRRLPGRRPQPGPGHGLVCRDPPISSWVVPASPMPTASVRAIWPWDRIQVPTMRSVLTSSAVRAVHSPPAALRSGSIKRTIRFARPRKSWSFQSPIVSAGP